MKFTTTTPVGCEGHSISYSLEKRCAEKLGKFLPDNYKVKFSWAQILMSDVQYAVDKRKKIVEVVYNQNLHIWWSQVEEAVKEALQRK